MHDRFLVSMIVFCPIKPLKGGLSNHNWSRISKMKPTAQILGIDTRQSLMGKAQVHNQRKPLLLRFSSARNGLIILLF